MNKQNAMNIIKKLNHLKRKIVKFFTNSKNKKLTILFIPQNQKKVHTFKLSKFLLITVFLIFITSISLGIYSFISFENVRYELYNLKKVEVDTNNFDFRGLSENIGLSVADLRAAVSKIQKTIGVDTNSLNLSDENQDLEKIFIKTNNGITNTVNSSINEIIKSVNNINELTTILKSYQEKFNVIPSIHPLLSGGKILSPFGWRKSPFTNKPEFHRGVDVAAPLGTPIRATADGIVKYAQYNKGNGNYVSIDHTYGFSTKYLHMNSIYVVAGQQVNKGQIIGTVGTTGLSTGYHIHYEVRINNEEVDPAGFIGLGFYWSN